MNNSPKENTMSKIQQFTQNDGAIVTRNVDGYVLVTLTKNARRGKQLPYGMGKRMIEVAQTYAVDECVCYPKRSDGKPGPLVVLRGRRVNKQSGEVWGRPTFLTNSSFKKVVDVRAQVA